MDNIEKTIAAIDIGTTKIATVVAQRKNEKFDILGFGTAPSTGIKHGVVQSIDETVKAITASINQLGDSYDANFNEVYVGIAGQYVSTADTTCRIFVGGYVTERHLVELKNMALNVVTPGSETIDAIPLSYAIAGRTVEDPIGKQCDYLFCNFHVISGQTAMVNNIKKCVTQAGLDVKTIFLEPLASAEAVLTEEEKLKGVVLIDIGGGTTDLAIYREGKLAHTAVISIGGTTVTGDIKNKFSMTYEQAESMKCMYGSAVHINGADVNIEVKTARVNSNLYISRNEMSEVIQSRMEELLNTVKFQIEMIFPNAVPAGIVMTGGGSLVANLNQLASFILKNNIRMAYPVANIEGRFAASLGKPQYSTVTGLIMKGYDYELGIMDNESSEPEEDSAAEAESVQNSVVESEPEVVTEPEPTPEPIPEPKPEPKPEPAPVKQPEPPKDPNRGFKTKFKKFLSKLEEEEE